VIFDNNYICFYNSFMKRIRPRARHFVKGGEAKKNSSDGLQDPSLELGRSDPCWRKLARRSIDVSVLIPKPEVYGQQSADADVAEVPCVQQSTVEKTEIGEILVDVNVELVTVTLPELSARSARQQT
jgi:hypothetical protein